MAFDRIPPPEVVEGDPEAVQRERREFMRRWKLKWSRLLRMRVTDRHIAELVGLATDTIRHKRNGQTTISTRMEPALTNIDTVIDANRLPYGCPEDLKRAIISYQIRHPLSRR